MVATKKAEKESKTFIEDYQLRTGWGSYVPSMLKPSYWMGGRQPDTPDKRMHLD